jgi:hypothetical protein
MDWSIIPEVDSDGKPHRVTKYDALAAGAFWGICGTVWAVGMILNLCWAGVIGAVVIPPRFEAPALAMVVVAFLTEFVVYYRCFRDFGANPNVETQRALAIFFIASIAILLAFPLVHVLVFSPLLAATKNGAYVPGMVDLSVALGVVPALPVTYALYRLMHLDLDRLAREGYRRWS